MLNLPFPYSLIYSILYATCLFSFLPFLIAPSNETDRLALLEIRAKLNDPLGVLSSWNNILHFCEWYGITCGRKHQRVTALDLHSSKLSGTLSAHLGNLSFLRELHLDNNSFSGIIPPEISSLQKLQIILIYNTSIEGEIPPNISSCHNLHYIDLSKNKLMGGIPPTLGFLTHLKVLRLGRNNLGGSIPSSIRNLSSLVSFVVADNYLVGRIPTSLGELKYLNTLHLFNNKFSGVIPPSIFNLSLLKSIDLSMNDLRGNLPSNLGNTLPIIGEFIIFDNKITGLIPASISNSTNLETLDMSENNLLGPVPSLHKSTKLTHLVLHNNFLGGAPVGDLKFVYSIPNATNLQWLEIGYNNFKGVFPRIICNFSSLTDVYSVQIYLTGEIPNCIESLANLYYFSVDKNDLSGAIPPGMWKLQNLIFLSLRGNQLSGPIPDSSGNITLLSNLDLSYNNFVGQIPSFLGNCKSLTYLDLSNNKISGNIPSKLFSIPTFSIGLYLSRNHLTGSLPEEVGQLLNLNTLDVSHNMLSGEIPSSLGSCSSLESLDMSENNFYGTIPHQFQTLGGLLHLNLSRNNLSGQIPKFLATLRLQSLDLSHNHFNGEVPIHGVFNNTKNMSIFGNTGLCGGLPELKLPHCNFRHNIPKKGSKHRKKLMLYEILSALSGVLLLFGIAIVSYMLCWKRRATKPTSSGDTENFPNLSYQTLIKATNGFATTNLIGSGTFGVVYKGILEEDGGTIAIKVFKLEYRGALKSFMAECAILRNIRHRNLVKVITACSSADYQGQDFKALIYEYMPNGSLEDWLHLGKVIISIEGTNNTSGKLNLRQRLDIAVDVVSALDYLHNQCGASIVHCDLKPSNVLLDDEMVAHVSDFGLARFLQKGTHTTSANQSSSMGVEGTIGYTPPEYGLGSEVSTCGDVYSFGILLLEMLTRKRPIDDMFKGSLSLHNFVKKALPEHVTDVIDHDLLEDMQGDERESSMILETLTTLLGIGISCSTDIPAERPEMSDVATKLSSIKNKLLGTHVQQRRRIQAGSWY